MSARTIVDGGDEELPDGLKADHLRPRGGIYRHASPVSVLCLGALLASTATGYWGALSPDELRAVSPEAELALEMPLTLRNGEFFEMRLSVLPLAEIEELGLAISPSLWRDFTQNTMVPQAQDETVKDGLFLFAYGPREMGDRLDIKIDLQINPSSLLGTEGEVALFDGERRIASLPVSIKVRP